MKGNFLMVWIYVYYLYYRLCSVEYLNNNIIWLCGFRYWFRNAGFDQLFVNFSLEDTGIIWDFMGKIYKYKIKAK